MPLGNVGDITVEDSTQTFQTYQLGKHFLCLRVDLDELEQPWEQLGRALISFLHGQQCLTDHQLRMSKKGLGVLDISRQFQMLVDRKLMPLASSLVRNVTYC